MTVTFEQQREILGADLVQEDGAGVIVGVCDTGIVEAHELLQGKVLEHFNFTGDEGEVRNFHGTAVASLVANIAPGVRFIDCRVLDNEGHGFTDWVMSGIEQAVESGAKVINLSLAGPTGCKDGTSFSNFLNALAEQGVTIVAAAGNEGGGGGGLPGGAQGTLAVGALSTPVNRASFSSMGPYCERVFPDVSAPGVDVEFALIDGGTGEGDGTSFASPLTAGVMALLRQKLGRGFTYSEREAALLASSLKNLGEESGKNNEVGYGLLSADGLLDWSESGEGSQCEDGFYWDEDAQMCLPIQGVSRSSVVPIAAGILGVALLAALVAKK